MSDIAFKAGAQAAKLGINLEIAISGLRVESDSFFAFADGYDSIKDVLKKASRQQINLMRYLNQMPRATTQEIKQFLYVDSDIYRDRDSLPSNAWIAKLKKRCIEKDLLVEVFQEGCTWCFITAKGREILAVFDGIEPPKGKQLYTQEELDRAVYEGISRHVMMDALTWSHEGSVAEQMLQGAGIDLSEGSDDSKIAINAGIDIERLRSMMYVKSARD